jgi:hypothetical protein
VNIKDLLLSRRVIDESTGCWLYTFNKTRDGYGKIKYKQRTYHVHRLAYEVFMGPIYDQILHKLHCPNRHCFNPAHLYDGTHQDNMDDRKESGNYINKNKFKTHCKNGHLLIRHGKKGKRYCNICRRIRNAKRT